MRYLVALACLVSLHATAGEAVLVAGDHKAQVRLYSETGPCTHGAQLAEFVEQGKEPIKGCWRLVGAHVRVAFLDGDGLSISVAHFQKPSTV